MTLPLPLPPSPCKTSLPTCPIPRLHSRIPMSTARMNLKMISLLIKNLKIQLNLTHLLGMTYNKRTSEEGRLGP
ncbi:hypothetical protein E2C01_017363 [Portunus trituberculatus]|uniref:Uncharacterized protein n=1 Tax=Portunus trituberculatus TaxID=210409 RepID=A0A5B7DTF7_PORTR|nr:hypothetical protein [Portunus trituberculatus]